MKDRRYYYLRCRSLATGRWLKDKQIFASPEAAEQRALAAIGPEGHASAVERVQVTVETTGRYYRTEEA